MQDLDSKGAPLYAFIYPGQGSQALGMGKSFRDNFKVARELSQRASDCLHLDMDKLLDSQQEKLNETEYTQPAIFLVSAMAQAIVESESEIKPALAFGHSLGEVSAYCLNGGATFDKAIKLVRKRGEYMFKACSGGDSKLEAGMLVSLGLKVEGVEGVCNELQKEGLQVWPANYNLENQLVLAGVKQDLKVAEQRLKAAGAKRAMLLSMNVASHCPLLAKALDPFREILESSLEDSGVPVLSNATLEAYTTKQKALAFLTDQLVKPVLYYKSVLKAKDLGIVRFIELGHGNLLAGLNSKISDIPTLSINSAESLSALGELT